MITECDSVAGDRTLLAPDRVFDHDTTLWTSGDQLTRLTDHRLTVSSHPSHGVETFASQLMIRSTHYSLSLKGLALVSIGFSMDIVQL